MISLEDYRMNDANGIGLYVGTYKKYCGGSLFGMWVNLEAVSDVEEFFDVCNELHKDEVWPEFMMQDYQGFPEELYSESMGNDDVERLLAYVALDDDDKEILDAFCSCYGRRIDDVDEMMQEAKNRCMGKYDSFKEFADEIADEKLACMNAPEFCSQYFDYESFARDLKYDYTVSGDGYIFMDR